MIDKDDDADLVSSGLLKRCGEAAKGEWKCTSKGSRNEPYAVSVVHGPRVGWRVELHPPLLPSCTRAMDLIWNMKLLRHSVLLSLGSVVAGSVDCYFNAQMGCIGSSDISAVLRVCSKIAPDWEMLHKGRSTLTPL
jgi:hypothetical protein